MKLTKLEKLVYVGCSWFFGMVMIVSGMIAIRANPVSIRGTVLICSGLICMSLYCICALLAKSIDEK